MRRLLQLLLAAVAVLLLATPTGSAFASHVECGAVITADTTLDADLLDCPGSGIVIGADGITLDLNGHVVDGDGVAGDETNGCGAGIANSLCLPRDRGHDDVTITGGTVREFETGVSIRRSAGVVISRTLFTGNESGVGLNDVTGATVKRNVFYRNGAHSIDAIEADGARIERNRAFANGNGIRLVSGVDGLIARNDVEDNAVIGITVEDGVNRNRIIHNRVHGNGHAGIVVFEGTRLNRVEHNAVSRNGHAPGIHFFDGGIVVDKDTHVSRNSVTGNSRGIVLSGHGQNRIVENRVTANVADGIVVELASDDPGRPQNILTGNVASANGDDGIDVEDPLTVLSANVARRNADLGIEAVPGVTDGGRNQAFANGNPLQCLNVICR